MESRVKKDALDVRNERNVESESCCKKKCSLGDQWEEDIELTIPPSSRQYELCFWR